MPRVRRRGKARQEYTASEVRLMLTGSSLTTRFGAIFKGTGDIKGLRKAWHDARGELMPQWIAERPFTRPWGFYRFDADQPRELAVGEQRIEAMEFYASHDERDYRVFTSGSDSLNGRLGLPGPYVVKDVWETEKQYLARIGALTAAEKDLM